MTIEENKDMSNISAVIKEYANQTLSTIEDNGITRLVRKQSAVEDHNRDGLLSSHLGIAQSLRNENCTINELMNGVYYAPSAGDC